MFLYWVNHPRGGIYDEKKTNSTHHGRHGCLTHSNFRGVYAADNLLTDKEHCIEQNNVTVNGQYDAKNETFTSQGVDNNSSLIKVENTQDKNNPGKLTIQNFDHLKFLGDKDATKPAGSTVWAAEGTIVKIGTEANKIGTIQFGTEDQALNSDQGIHAAGGDLTINADTITGNVTGNGFMSQSWGSHNGTLNVEAKDVNLTGQNGGLVAAGIFQNTPNNMATNTIHATNNIYLHAVKSNVGVVYFYDSLSGKGNANIDISGDKGVQLVNDNGIGIYSYLQGQNNQGDIEITSSDGDVSIQSTDQAIFSGSSYASSDGKAASNINLYGANINLVSQNRQAILLWSNASATLAAKDKGTITISGGNGTAAEVGNSAVKENNASLVIGKDKDGNTYDNTVMLNGQIKISDGGTVTVAGKTTTVVDASSLKGNSLVSVSGGTFTAEEGAKLIVKGANTGTTLYDTKQNIDFWKTTSFDNPFQCLKDGKVEAGITDANKEAIAGYAASGVAVAATKNNDEKMTSLIKSGKESYNGALSIGQAAGIQHSTYAVTGLFTDALSDHDNTPVKDLWAKGFHSKENIDGLGFAGGALSLDTQYNGTVVGMDVYQNEHTTAGVALTYADGNISSSNGGVYTKNDATYVGASLYGLKDLGSYRLVADLSYVGGSHDITQYNNGQVITAKPDTEAWTLGVKAMKDYTVGQGLLTPYVGLRYLRLTTDKYTSSASLSYDKETQDLCLLPVGVDYSLQMNRGSWILKPYAGLSYIWTMGDRNANQTVTYGTATDGFAYDISDAGSFLGKLGLSASKGDYSFGVGYTYQNGSTTDSHTWTVQASYAF